MRQFKKKTLALILASTITVVGSFGAENYKNSLMSLEFSNESSGSVNVKLFTKLNYENNITLQKKDATTYIIMLPETDGQTVKKPELAPNIESVDIKTMPYTTNNKGYTKITVKTTTNIPMIATKALYIPSKEKTDNEQDVGYTEPQPANNSSQQNNIREDNTSNNANKTATPSESPSMPAAVKTEKSQQYQPSSENVKAQTKNKIEEESNEYTSDSTESSASYDNTTEQDKSSEIIYLVLGALLIIFASVFLYLKGKDKIAQIIGEQGDFSLDIDEEKIKTKNIKSTINKLDKTYKNPVKMPLHKETSTIETVNTIDITDNDQNSTEESVVVDLDELYNTKTNEYNNDALDDFLSDFNFEEENETPQTEELNIDDSLFEKYIENGNLKFSKEDVEKINELINIEINNETLNNISDYAVSNPIEKIQPEKLTKLENFVTSYVIQQNISFTQEDIDALEKLINIEIDPDFVTDLTTNPERAAQMQKEIEAREISHKNHEMLTLNVKDVLPDLSEALKKQGNKKIESEVKPQVVYFSEGYDVNTLHINKDDIPDITLDLDNPEYKKYRPSDDFELKENKYELTEISVKNELPDLNDAMVNPEKYEEKKEIVKADEEALLKNIANVTFKPIYTGNENIEILNTFDDDIEEKESSSVDETSIAEEINAHENNISEPVSSSEKDEIKVQDNNIKPEKDEIISRTNDKAKELIKIIDEQQKERNIKRINQPVQPKNTKPKEAQNVTNSIQSEIKNCLVEGEQYSIISTSKLSDKMGCYLAKNDKEYAILGFIGESIFKIKYYETLTSNKLQTRVNEKLDENTTQYLVRIGIHKFIVNVTKDNMEYVMDLC